MLMEIHTIESVCLNYGPVIFYRQGRFFGVADHTVGISRRQQSIKKNKEPVRIQSKNNQTA